MEGVSKWCALQILWDFPGCAVFFSGGGGRVAGCVQYFGLGVRALHSEVCSAGKLQ